MKKWRSVLPNTKQALCSQRGETLVESMVSILIFSIFMLAVTTTIMASLKLSESATQTATAQQNAANQALLSPVATEGELQASATSAGISVRIPVLVANDAAGILQSFRPKVEVPTSP